MGGRRSAVGGQQSAVGSWQSVKLRSSEVFVERIETKTNKLQRSEIKG